ncbi:hypothetical protein B5S33_g407 [[Candida] boidinii]|nr:hypothetical protein B5S33_g407 [[Candida] boidinii]
MSSPSSKNTNNKPIRSTSLSNRLSKLRGNNSSGQNSANSSVNGKLTSPSLSFEDPLLQQQQQQQQQQPLSEFPDPTLLPSPSISTNDTTPVPSPQPFKSIQNNSTIKIPELKLTRPTLDYFSDPSFDDNNNNDNFFDSIEPDQNNFGVAINKSKSPSMSYALKLQNLNNGNSPPNNGVCTGDISANGSPVGSPVLQPLGSSLPESSPMNSRRRFSLKLFRNNNNNSNDSLDEQVSQNNSNGNVSSSSKSSIFKKISNGIYISSNSNNNSLENLSDTNNFIFSDNDNEIDNYQDINAISNNNNNNKNSNDNNQLEKSPSSENIMKRLLRTGRRLSSSYKDKDKDLNGIYLSDNNYNDSTTNIDGIPRLTQTSVLAKPLNNINGDDEFSKFKIPLDKKSIPPELIDPGIELLRITRRKKIKRCFKIDIDKNILLWNNKQSSFIEIDNIKSIRVNDNAKNYREEFKISSDYKNLWITIIYYNQQKSNSIKALHVIATNSKDYDLFINTLKNLVFFRNELNRSLSSNANNELFTVLHWNNSVTDNNKINSRKSSMSSSSPYIQQQQQQQQQKKSSSLQSNKIIPLPSSASTPTLPSANSNATSSNTNTNTKTNKENPLSIDTILKSQSDNSEISSKSKNTSSSITNFSNTNSTSLKENERLSFAGVVRLAKRLHIHVHETYLRSLFDQVDEDHNNYLDFDEFKKFVKLLRIRNEFRQTFLNFCSNPNIGMTLSEFKKFLIETQMEKIEDDKLVKKIYQKFTINMENHNCENDDNDDNEENDDENDNSDLITDNSTMSIDGFSDFLISSYTSHLKQIQEDYTRPLNEYYISSSHNTYLLGRQWNGISSIEGYIKTLQRGCRCIEIDIWDGNNGPIVTHGRTFTSSIDFIRVAETIRKYAFITSPYPLLLSLEIRCNLKNQIEVEKILRDTLQGLLLTAPLTDMNETVLPSPEELKHKVLVKVKKSQFDPLTDMDYSDSSTTTTTTTTTPTNTSNTDTNLTTVNSNSSSFSEDNSNSLKLVLSNPSANSISSTTAKLSKKFLKRQKKLNLKIAYELGQLGIYLIGKKFRNFSLPESKTFNHVFSFSEKTINKMMKDDSKIAAISKHNRKFLMRLYPSLYRITSSNFNPIPFWELGCQMVATNWQYFDVGQQLNEAMFAVGSNSGYILKPENLRKITNQRKLNHELKTLKNYTNKKYIEIDIISAQQLPKPKDLKSNLFFDPYVEMEFYGGLVVDASIKPIYKDSSVKIKNGSCKILNRYSSQIDLSSQLGSDLAQPSVIFQTQIISKNGFNPIWNQKCKLRYYANDSNLTFVRFVFKSKVSNSSTPATPLSFPQESQTPGTLSNTTTSSSSITTVSSVNSNNSSSSVNSLTSSTHSDALPSQSDTVIGSFCCKLDHLKQGYRHVPLYDAQGEEYIFSTFFMKINYGDL